MDTPIAPLLVGTATTALAYLSLRRKPGKMPTRVADPIKDIPEYIKRNKYPAKSHNLRVANVLAEDLRDDIDSAGFLIGGNVVEHVKYCDGTKRFRQERYFYYLSGIDIPGSVVFYDCKSRKLILFLPPIDCEDVIWSGMPMEPDEVLQKFDFDEVYYMDKLCEVILQNYGHLSVLYTTDIDNLDRLTLSKELLALIKPGDEHFFHAMDECRAIKDEYEIEVLRHAAKISDNSHYAVMSALPIEVNEIQLEAEFGYHATRQGARFQGYDPICCSGPACGTLHYVKNDGDLRGKSSVLIDAGAEWMNYTTDVTRCFPISGKFTREHRAIYDAVLDMQTQTMQLMKPGVKWDDLHILSHRVLIKHLIKLGILKGDEYSEEEIFQSRVSCAFYPHGLGHLMGLDVHDVGGYPNYEDPDPYFKYLRMRRELRANMVITNEPGCYFNEHLLSEFLDKFPERRKMVNLDVLEKYMYVGGVRIEDDILITKDGYENLTGITSDPEEIESIVSNGLRKARSEFHNVV